MSLYLIIYLVYIVRLYAIICIGITCFIRQVLYWFGYCAWWFLLHVFICPFFWEMCLRTIVIELLCPYHQWKEGETQDAFGKQILTKVCNQFSKKGR